MRQILTLSLFLEINVFEENGRKEGVDQVDQVGEAEIECVIGVSRQVIIIFILRNWWRILKKKEIIKNMKINTVLTKKKKKKTHRTQIINIGIKRKQTTARVLALYKSYWAAMNKFFIYERPYVNKDFFFFHDNVFSYVFRLFS